MKRITTYFSITIALFAFTQCSLFNFGEDPPKIPGKLLFHTYNKERTLSLRLFSMKANGENVRDFTRGSGRESYFGSWTDHGDSLLFSSHYEGTTLGPGIFKTDAKGKNTRGVTFQVNPTYSIPHPGNQPKQIENSIYYALQASIYKLGLDDNSITNITQGYDWFEYHYDFSVQANNPSYVFTNSSVRKSDIYTLRRFNLMTETVDSLISVEGWAGRPSISPDGKHLLFCDGTYVRGAVRMLDVESKSEIPLNLDYFNLRVIDWNQTGTHVLMYGKRTRKTKRHLYYFAFNEGNFALLDSLSNQYVIDGEGFDWYAD